MARSCGVVDVTAVGILKPELEISEPTIQHRVDVCDASERHKATTARI
jgi:hypothetical protein